MYRFSTELGFVGGLILRDYLVRDSHDRVTARCGKHAFCWQLTFYPAIWHKPSRWCVAMTWDPVSLHFSDRGKPTEVKHLEILTSTNNAAYCQQTHLFPSFFLISNEILAPASRFVLASWHWWRRCLCWRPERGCFLQLNKSEWFLGSGYHSGLFGGQTSHFAGWHSWSWSVLTCADGCQRLFERS